MMHIQDMGYNCSFPCIKLLITKRQRLKPRAKKKKTSTVADCSKVFSDESEFCILFGNQVPKVWRKSGETHNTSCLRCSVKFPQLLMVWGAMSSAGVGLLCSVKTKVIAAIYHQICCFLHCK